MRTCMIFSEFNSFCFNRLESLTALEYTYFFLNAKIAETYAEHAEIIKYFFILCVFFAPYALKF